MEYNINKVCFLNVFFKLAIFFSIHQNHRKKKVRGEERGKVRKGRRNEFYGKLEEKVDKMYTDKSHIKYLNISLSKFTNTTVLMPLYSW